MLWVLIKIFFGKEMYLMAIVYATLIVKGKKAFADVPEKIKGQVKEILIDLDCENLAV